MLDQRVDALVDPDDSITLRHALATDGNDPALPAFSGMHILKYFLFVGPALTVALWAWAASLEPVPTSQPASQPTPAQAVAEVAVRPEPFRPTPAPPLAELEPAAPAVEPAAQPAAAPEPAAAAPEPAVRKAERHSPKIRKTAKVRRGPPPSESYAYSPQPFFFGWH
jgi:hypothetical protein